MQQPDGQFDLIFAFSVFTHLVDSWSAWLLELHRVLKVGGLLIVTVFGPGHSSVGEEPVGEEIIGMNILYPSATWDLGGPLVLHSEWWLRAHSDQPQLETHSATARDREGYTGPLGLGSGRDKVAACASVPSLRWRCTRASGEKASVSAGNPRACLGRAAVVPAQARDTIACRARVSRKGWRPGWFGDFRDVPELHRVFS